MTYEELQIQYKNLNIVEMDLSEVNGLKGLYFDGNIAIEKDMSKREKSCILAEEIGHYRTTSGDILNQDEVSNQKQEYRARLYGYNLKIGLTGIINAFKAGCQNLYEMAEYLDCTEDYLRDALKCYNEKYGIFVILDNYAIFFEPLRVVHIISEND